MFGIGMPEILILTPLIISIVLFIIGLVTKKEAIKYINGAILMFFGLYFIVLHLTMLSAPVSIFGIILLIHTYFKFKKGGTDYTFCTQCGSKNHAGNDFCSDCGTKFS